MGCFQKFISGWLLLLHSIWVRFPAFMLAVSQMSLTTASDLMLPCAFHLYTNDNTPPHPNTLLFHVYQCFGLYIFVFHLQACCLQMPEVSGSLETKIHFYVRYLQENNGTFETSFLVFSYLCNFFVNVIKILLYFFLTLNSFTNKQTKTQNMHHAQGSLFCLSIVSQPNKL